MSHSTNAPPPNLQGPDSQASDEDFSLFDAEERVLADADRMTRQLHEVANWVQTLADAYRRSYREQRRLVRLSDRMQHELQMTKQELAGQADDLRALNEVLRSEAAQRAQLTDELFRMATTDLLTGAATRRHLFDLGNYEIAKRARTGEPMSALMVDLDHFKRINDTHGHLAGDAVLKRFAEITTSTIRNTDIFARYGGEEFVILLPGTGATRAAEIAERLRDAVAAGPTQFEGIEIPLTISIGLASIAEEHVSLEYLLSRADNALYAAKRYGRDRIVTAGSTEAE